MRQEDSLKKACEVFGVTNNQLNTILDVLQRDPTLTELAMFSVEWSEHCGYGKSRHLLKTLPKKGSDDTAFVETDAGGFKFDEYDIVFKVESHNHPSQIEPHSGAATGVGGIIRDIVGSGARPIALLNSIHFGLPRNAENNTRAKGVVDGIQHYGNCVGVPTVNGETHFESCYENNTLVNVMCVGVRRNSPSQKTITSHAVPHQNVYYLGAATGKDGVGGCSVLASQELSTESQNQRPSVQIGDPFLGKCLLEATLESLEKNLFLSLKDMGAAGLTCTTAEMSHAGKCGMIIHLDNVPLRDPQMQPYEIMLSESQERMLAVVSSENAEKVENIFKKWGLYAVCIGKTIPENSLEIHHQNNLVADLSVPFLVECPAYPPQAKPIPQIPASALNPSGHWKEEILALLSSANLADKSCIFEQFDWMVQTSTQAGPQYSEASVIRLDEKKGIAVTLNSAAKQNFLDPFKGSQHALSHAYLNLTCANAVPTAITNCLNFGNPDKSDRFWQFSESISGFKHFAEYFQLPVISGNVSFYNETQTSSIYPTPTFGMVGKIHDVSRSTIPFFFQTEGDCIAILGQTGQESLNGSEYESYVFEKTPSGEVPELNLRHLENLSKSIQSLLNKNILTSIKVCGRGGLVSALLKSSFYGETGCSVNLASLWAPGKMTRALTYFGESSPRILVSFSKKYESEILKNSLVPIHIIGHVTEKNMVIDDIKLSREELKTAFYSLRKKWYEH